MTRWQMFTEAFEEWRQQRLQNRALIQASRLFELLRPQWYQALFDEPFLRRFEPSALLEMNARDLAIEWARQFSYADPRRRDREIEQVTEVAAHFKELLQAAMSDLETRRVARSSRLTPTSTTRASRRTARLWQ